MTNNDSSLFVNVPRLGYTNDITTTFSGEFDDIEPYVRGLTFIPLLLMSFTLLCLLLVLIFKCCSVGFLSGKRFDTNSHHTTPVRITFCLCSILWIISIILIATKGFQNLRNSLGVITQTNADILRLSGKGVEIAQSLTKIGDNSSIMRDKLLEYLAIDRICPNNDINQVIGIEFSSIRNTAIDSLTTLSNFFSDAKVDQILTGLDDLEEGSERVDDELELVDDEYDGTSIVFLILWIMVPSFMLVGVALTFLRPRLPSFLECLLQWLFLPLLFLMTIFSGVMASIASILAVANADFCATSSSSAVSTSFQYSGPRLSIILLAESLELDESIMDVARYYLSSCQDGENPFTTIQEYMEDYLPSASESLSTLLKTISKYGAENLDAKCNSSYNFLDLEKLIIALEETVLSKLLNIIKNVIGLLDCNSEISPLISRMLDEGTCDYSLNGLAWVVIGFSVMTILGFILILFRSSYLGLAETETYETDEADEADEDHCSLIQNNTPESSVASKNDHVLRYDRTNSDSSSSDLEVPSKIGTTPDSLEETLMKPLTPEDNGVALPKPLTPVENGLADYSN